MTAELAGERTANEGLSTSKTTIQSVSRASKILLAVAASPDGLLAKEVAVRFGLSLPTAYHLLTTLSVEALLVKDERRRYVLGPSAAVIAARVDRDTAAPEYYLRPLRDLAAATGETAYLSAWRAGEITVLATIEGAQAVRVVGLTTGYGKNIHARASGKLLLAFAKKAVVDEVLSGVTLRKLTPHTITTRAALDREFAQIRDTGLSFDRQEFTDDVRCVSAPIRQDGVVVACYTVSAPAARFEEHRAAMIEAVEKAANAASDSRG